MTAGLDAIHRRNIIHRDIKLSNLLIDNDLNVQYIDFGLAEKVQEGQLLTDRCGTEGYQSPEMFRRHP